MFSFGEGLSLEINKLFRITSSSLDMERAEEIMEKSLGERLRVECDEYERVLLLWNFIYSEDVAWSNETLVKLFSNLPFASFIVLHLNTLSWALIFLLRLLSISNYRTLTVAIKRRKSCAVIPCYRSDISVGGLAYIPR